MSKRIVFLTTAHAPLDDRIYYHQSQSLKARGHSTYIISTTSSLFLNSDNEIVEGFDINSEYSISEKSEFFLTRLLKYKPDCIICSEPLPVSFAHRYKNLYDRQVSIIYDITEWYPSKKNLRVYRGGKKIFVAGTMYVFNILAGLKTDAFLYGERSKMFPFSVLFPRKPNLVLPYFPSSRYIHFKPHVFDSNRLTLCYTGKLSEEKGVGNFIRAVHLFRQSNPLIQVIIKIVGVAECQQDQDYFDGLLRNYGVVIDELIPLVPFHDFTQVLSDVDICFDLRSIDYENSRCLPIKIFYYAACGKPVVYSNLKAISQSVEIDKFGYLVDPSNSQKICDILELYTKNASLYTLHSTNARQLFLDKYNWESQEDQFCNFIESLIK